MVPIRDPGLIGRKIDCPKCKYRFIVEEPQPEEDEDEDRPAAKKKGITNKPSAKGPGKAGKPGRRGDDDDDDRPSRKQDGSSKMLVLGIGLAVVGVAAIGICLWLFMGQGDSPSTASNSSPAPAPASSTPPPKAADKGPAKETVNLANVTNLLPNDSQVVISYPMNRLLASSIKAAALDADGGFKEERFNEKMGFPLREVTRVITTLNIKKNWVFTVVRTKKPYNQDHLKAALRLQAEPRVKSKTGKMYDLYILKGDLDSLGTALFQASLPRENFAVHFLDEQTLVFADVGPLQQFLESDTKPEYRTKPPSAGGPSKPATSGTGGTPPTPAPGGGGLRPATPGAGGAGMPTPGGPTPPATGGGGRPAPGGTTPPAVGGGGPPPNIISGAGMGGGRGGRPGMGGMGGMGPPGMGGDSAAPPPPPPVLSDYLTIDPDLKVILDRMEKREENKETKKKELVNCIAVALNAEVILDAVAQEARKQFTGGLVERAQFEAGLLAVRSQFKNVGISLVSYDQTSSSAVVALEVASTSVAQSAEKTARDALPRILPTLKDLIGVKVALDGSQPELGPPGMAGMMGGAGGMMQPGGPRGGSGPPPGIAGAAMGPRGAGMGPRGMGPRGMTGPPGLGGAGGSPNLPGTGPGNEGKEDEKPDLTLKVSAEERLLVFSVEGTLPNAAYTKSMVFVEEGLARVRSQADLATHRSWAHELARATQAHLKEKGAFPQGALPRPESAERGIPWRPDERLSWAAALLPYLGPEYRDWNLKPELGWKDDPNLRLAVRVVPALVGGKQIKPADPSVPYHGIDFPVGTTYWVGMSGLGLDAADYAADDPAAARKLGVFGYDRVTRREDVKDGLDQTIVLIMVPAEHRGSWLAGGGSTLRGVSDDAEDARPIAPFVCVVYPSKGDVRTKWTGKRGTLAVMGDGKVRFIPEDIAPETFRALCTIAGGERIDNLNAVAPVIEDDSEHDLKTDGPGLPGVGPSKPPLGKPADKKTTAWKDFTPASKAFTVKMPGDPSEIKNTVPSPAGNLTIIAYVLKQPNQVLGVTVTEMPAAALKDGADQLLGGVKVGLTAVSGTKVVSEEKITLGSHPGREFVITTPKVGTRKIRAYLVGSRLFTLEANPVNADNEKDFKTFFDSFRVP
jgi:hypothetical protein